MRKLFMKGFCIFFAVFLCCLCFAPFATAAASGVNPMKSTYVVDDLYAYGFNLNDYALDESSDYVSLMHFQEYGFDKNGNRNYYGLYVYVYNASGKPIEKKDNFIQLSYNDGNFYKKYSLELLSVSNDSNNENIFYKFRVLGIEDIAQLIHKDVRHYFISGIELNFADDSMDDDYGVQQHWEYSGYQFNFGSNIPTGTLMQYCTKLETVEIDLHGARWFSEDSDLGHDFRYEVSSVYFAIPNAVINEYGNIHDPAGTSGLISVQGCYNKYGINGLIVESQDAYNEFSPALNKNRNEIAYDVLSGKYYDDPDHLNFWANYIANWPSFYSSKHKISSSGSVEYIYYSLGYNPSTFDVTNEISHLMLLHKGSSPEVSEDALLDLWLSSGKPCHLTPDTLYMGSFTNGISKDLQYFNISVEDGDLSSSIKSFVSTKKTQFGKVILKLFNKELWDNPEVYPECKPLQEITYFNLKDLFFTDKAMCNDMYMSYEDLCEFDDFYDDKNLGNHIYVMRFGVDPYYCTELDHGTNITTKNGERGWYYEKTVYDNFYVLSFTFRNEKGGISVVPVNAKPITIIGSIVPGSNDGGYSPNPQDKSLMDWLKALIAFLKKLKIFPILMGILLVLLIVKFVWPLLKKLGNARLEVAKARASDHNNEKRDKSPPTAGAPPSISMDDLYVSEVKKVSGCSDSSRRLGSRDKNN